MEYSNSKLVNVKNIYPYIINNKLNESLPQHTFLIPEIYINKSFLIENNIKLNSLIYISFKKMTILAKVLVNSKDEETSKNVNINQSFSDILSVQIGDEIEIKKGNDEIETEAEGDMRIYKKVKEIEIIIDKSIFELSFDYEDFEKIIQDIDFRISSNIENILIYKNQIAYISIKEGKEIRAFVNKIIPITNDIDSSVFYNSHIENLNFYVIPACVCDDEKKENLKILYKIDEINYKSCKHNPHNKIECEFDDEINKSLYENIYKYNSIVIVSEDKFIITKHVMKYFSSSESMTTPIYINECYDYYDIISRLSNIKSNQVRNASKNTIILIYNTEDLSEIDEIHKSRSKSELADCHIKIKKIIQDMFDLNIKIIFHMSSFTQIEFLDEVIYKTIYIDEYTTGKKYEILKSESISKGLVSSEFMDKYKNEIYKYLIGFNTSHIDLIIKRLEIILKSTNQVNENTHDYVFNILTEVFDFIKHASISNKSSSISSSIPSVKWDQVGGLDSIKNIIYETIQLPIKYSQLFNNRLQKRSGLLIYGPPGSGKTLLAKAIATESCMNFISVKGPELLNQYVGESEKNIRDIFNKAKANSPCVLFFDEIDALAPKRHKSSDSGNVMDRIVSQIMTELDNFNNNKNDEHLNIIIASTNRPDLVDSSLLRPGRFDKMIYVGLPKTSSEKYKILKSILKNTQDDELIKEVSERCPEIYSGADISALCNEAYSNLIKKQLETINVDTLKKNEVSLKLNINNFIEAFDKVPPSLTIDEIRKYEKLKDKYGN